MVLQSLPRRSSQLINRGASALVKFFEDDDDVVYLYGPAGSGKTYALDMLAQEYGYDIVRMKGPLTREVVNLYASANVFMVNRKLVLVDITDLSASDIKTLSEGGWGTTKLVIVGEEYPKKSPLRTHLGKQDYRYTAVKFHQFTKNDITGCLSLYALEMGVSISYEVINRIGDAADGDMRAARMCLKALIASEDEDALETFLPFSDMVYNNEIKKLFSGNRTKAREAVETFSPFVSILILRENILKFRPDDEVAMRLLYKYANLDADVTEQIIDLACYLGKHIKTYVYAYYRKAKPINPPSVDVDCSDAKKILYFTGFEKLMEDATG